MAADIDVRSIAAFSSLPESVITGVLDQPTKDLVKSLLEAIQSKAKEHDVLKSEKVKTEVEHETFVRTSESKVKVLQNTRDKALADASKLRGDLQNAENARSRTEAELEHHKQSTAGEATEISNLRSRIVSLEASNRDTLSLLDSKNAANDRLSQELSAQHTKVVELRKQVSTLEQANQTAASALASARFREQSLEQELNLQKKNNEWLENERKIKSEEHTNFRKEKNARISELTRTNEQHIEEIEMLRRSENALKSRIEEQINKNEELSQQIQKFREKEIADADSYRIELESVNRLAQLQEASANTAKQRVEELQLGLEEVREEAANEIGEIRAEVEAEHQEREAAEQRVAELESRIAELEAAGVQIQTQPMTPRRDLNGHGVSTPLRPATPSGIFTPSLNARLKGASGNLTVSQLYGEYKQLERELATERRTNVELQSNMDAMLEDLEAKRPEIEELRDDQNRLQSELFEMSTLLERANHERDDVIKQARLLQGQLDATSKELNDYQQTVRDRNSQLRWMVMDKEARDQGGSLSEAEFQELQRAAVDADARDSEHLSEMQRKVSQQLVLFKSVTELQEQNANQLVTIRDLLSRLESAESKEIQQQNHRLKEELEAANTKIGDYKAASEQMVVQAKSFAKERDMFKNMLTRRGHLSATIDANDFSKSLPLPPGGSTAHEFDGRASTGSADYGKLLQDLQKHFDNYRQEAAIDVTALRNQLNEMSKRNAQLQTEASRATGQLTAAVQRTEMLQANFNMVKTENAEIQKRSYAAMETATKQEMRTAQAAEELVEAKGILESLRRESANLKAEKDLWKNVEMRLIEDNEALRNERGRLDQLNGSLQNILNEREQADSETRRRLQSQLETLESELATTKRRLVETSEESKQLTLRREYEHQQSQKRIDDLVTSLSQIREELAAVKTTRDHLQARVDELNVELKSAEERVELLTRPLIEPGERDGGTVEDALSREQELSVEISELKRDLELKTSELDRSQEQIEVYKGIAQSAEERLQQLVETNDEFKAETEAAIAEKDGIVQTLEQRIEDISTELNTTTSELTSLRDEQAESHRRLDEQKHTYETEIVRLKDAEEKSLEQAQFNLEATRAQAEIASEAQQNYENELLKHADAAKNLNIIRGEANQLRLEAVDLKTQVETARHDLEQKELSWSDMKDRYEREVLDLKRRRDEVAQQNTILHGQLETLTQQITSLQRDRAALAESESTDTTDDAVKDRSDLQEVIKFLRRDKEIVDVQYHLSTQEAKRLRQQLDFAQSQLDETRLKLDQQQRHDADSERNAISHQKLMNTLNELNLFRESSVTLRAEAKQANQALSDKTKRVEELEAEIQPLRARISELENLSELREGEMKLLQDDRDHWQQRCHNILSKYDRVDPAELESLKSKLTTLESERDLALSTRDELQAQVDSHPAQIETAKSDLRTRLAEQYKGRSQQLTAKIREKQAELDVALAEKASLQTELDSTREELDTARAESNQGEPRTQTAPATVELTGGNSEADVKVTELQTKIDELASQLSEKDDQIQSLNSTSDEKFKAREHQLKEMLNKRLAEVKQQANSAKDAALEELRQQLAAEHQQELEALRAQSVPVAPSLQQAAGVPAVATDTSIDQPASTVPNFEAFVESITEAQAKQLVQKNSIIRSIVTSNIKKRVEAEKEALRQELATAATSDPSIAATGDETSAGSEEYEKKFQAAKEAIIKQKEEEFTLERQKISDEFDAKLEAERQKVIAEKDAELASERLYFSEESEKKIAEQVANAQALAEKRATVKLNMAQNQARVANARLEVVSKAAEETPEKSVKEVWEVAKVAKPPPQQAKSTVPASPAANKISAPAPSTPVATTTSAPVSSDTAATAATNGTSDRTVTEGAGPAQNASEEQLKPVQAVPVSSAQPRSQIPQTRGAIRGGRGGAIPVAAAQQASQAGRGSGIPRGGARGRGTGRGGVQSGVSNATGAIRGGGTLTGSPSRGALNPGAQQFTPGNKRARDENEAGADGNGGKRIRGGGQGGA